MTEYDYFFKIITVGYTLSGRRSYVLRVTENIFPGELSQMVVDFVRIYYYYEKF